MNVNTNLKARLLQGEPVRSSCRKLGSILLLLVIAALPSWAQNYMTTPPNDPFYRANTAIESPLGQWGLKQIHAEDAWKVSTGSRDNSNVIVVIDSGIDYLHEDLMDNLWTSKTNIVTPNGLICAPGTHGFDLTTLDRRNRCLPWDWDGPGANHGTIAAGIIGAAGNNGKGVVGVNWAAKIMAIRAEVSEQATADAINFAVNLKYLFTITNGAEGANVRVINISRGSQDRLAWASAETAIRDAAKEDILVVASAGNDGKDNDSTPMYPASFSITEPNVISVAATDPNDSLAYWQEPDVRGPAYPPIWKSSNFGVKSVDLAAPGKEVVTTYRHDWVPPSDPTIFNRLPLLRGYGRHSSGTSYAAPFVSGAAALILSACDVDAATLKTFITDNVDIVTALAQDLHSMGLTQLVKSGGRLNVNKAIRSCILKVWYDQIVTNDTRFTGMDANTLIPHTTLETSNPGWSISAVQFNFRVSGTVWVYLATKQANPANRWVMFWDPDFGKMTDWQWAGRYLRTDWRSQ